MRGFTAGPIVGLGEGHGANISIAWNGSPRRMLVIQGEPTGLDLATGTVRARMWVATPDALTEPELRRYLADPRIVGTNHLAVFSGGGEQRTIVLGGGLASPPPPNLRPPLLEFQSMSLGSERYFKTPGVVEVLLDPRAPGLQPLDGGFEASLVQELLAGPIGCTVSWKGGAASRCSITLGSTLLWNGRR
jgi:hypothetical protein